MKASTDLRYAISLSARGKTDHKSAMTVRNRFECLSGVLGECGGKLQAARLMHGGVFRAWQGRSSGKGAFL